MSERVRAKVALTTASSIPVHFRFFFNLIVRVVNVTVWWGPVGVGGTSVDVVDRGLGTLGGSNPQKPPHRPRSWKVGIWMQLI